MPAGRAIRTKRRKADVNHDVLRDERGNRRPTKSRGTKRPPRSAGIDNVREALDRAFPPPTRQAAAEAIAAAADRLYRGRHHAKSESEILSLVDAESIRLAAEQAGDRVLRERQAAKDRDTIAALRDHIARRVDALRKHQEVGVMDMEAKREREDWHGVADAACDIRDLVAAREELLAIKAMLA